MRPGGHLPQVLIFSKDDHKEHYTLFSGLVLIFPSVNYGWIREGLQELQLLSAGGRDAAAAALSSCLPAERVPNDCYLSLHPRYLQPWYHSETLHKGKRHQRKRLIRQRILSLNTEASAIMKGNLMRQAGWTLTQWSRQAGKINFLSLKNRKIYIFTSKSLSSIEVFTGKDKKLLLSFLSLYKTFFPVFWEKGPQVKGRLSLTHEHESPRKRFGC